MRAVWTIPNLHAALVGRTEAWARRRLRGLAARNQATAWAKESEYWAKRVIRSLVADRLGAEGVRRRKPRSQKPIRHENKAPRDFPCEEAVLHTPASESREPTEMRPDGVPSAGEPPAPSEEQDPTVQDPPADIIEDPLADTLDAPPSVAAAEPAPLVHELDSQEPAPEGELAQGDDDLAGPRAIGEAVGRSRRQMARILSELPSDLRPKDIGTRSRHFWRIPRSKVAEWWQRVTEAPHRRASSPASENKSARRTRDTGANRRGRPGRPPAMLSDKARPPQGAEPDQSRGVAAGPSERPPSRNPSRTSPCPRGRAACLARQCSTIRPTGSSG